MDESVRNYWAGANDSYLGFKERINANDVITDVCRELEGIIEVSEGRYEKRPEIRFMNELGIARVRGLLKGVVNKVNHLTKYENNARVLLQVKSQIQTFIPELVCNLRNWAPPGKPKVPNWPLVLTIIESTLLASMLRGEGGFEAKNITQQHTINEIISRDRQKKGLFGGFGGRNDEN